MLPQAKCSASRSKIAQRGCVSIYNPLVFLNAKHPPQLGVVAQCPPDAVQRHRHIALAQPKLIVLLGAVSVRHVLGLNEGIMRARGRWETYQNPQLGHPVPVMPTLHPAFLLRQPGAKRLVWRDLLTISDKIDSLGLA